MFSNGRLLHDVSVWARGNGLEIVLIVIGTILLTRLATWLGARITRRIDAEAGRRTRWSARKPQSTGTHWRR